ncbi:TPA: hypothetical protein DE059_03650 [Candidatus Peribacteria bacterium]|nr:hypothetical protein [Candidatus Peribacteria bacterium]|tara:strand:+ start:3391 stop:4191 length:801 start_codon:yes stop_codon:yes gene_type:complete
MRYLKLITGLTAALYPTGIAAISLVPGNACVSSTGISCNANVNTTLGNLANAGITVFGAFLFAMFVFYGFRMLVSTSDENIQTETRKAVVFAIFGAVLVAGARIFANSFTNWGTLVDAGNLEANVLTPVKLFIEGLVGIALLVTITFQGIRMILSEDESQSSAARKRFIEGLIGAIVIVLLDTIVDAFIPTGSGMGQFTTEMAGIGKFMATIFGFLATITIIVGGIMLVASVNDALKDRGKQLVIGGIIGLVVVWMSYAIIHAFLS